MVMDMNGRSHRPAGLPKARPAPTSRSEAPVGMMI